MTPAQSILLDLLRRTDAANLALRKVPPISGAPPECWIEDTTLGGSRAVLILAQGLIPCAITEAIMAVIKDRDELIIQIRDAAEIWPSVPDSAIPGITREIYTAKNPKEEVQF